MARQTRQQRRERRKADGVAPAAAPPPRRPPAALDAAADDDRGREPAPRAAERREAARRGRRFNFVRESYGELRKVEWPNQRQVINGTVAVLIACLVVGVFLYASDQAFKNLVEKVFLR